jgi:hypothetical protein
MILRERMFASSITDAARVFRCIGDFALQAGEQGHRTELTEKAFRLAADALEDDERTLIAQEFFAELATSRIRGTSDKARAVLLDFLKKSIAIRPIASKALSALGSIENVDSLSLIESALPRDAAQDALVRLTTAQIPKIAMKARNLAIRFVRDALARDQPPLSAIRALAEIESPESLALARQALSRPELAFTARAILEKRLSKSSIAEVAAGARQAIAEFLTSNQFEERDVLSRMDTAAGPAATDLPYLEDIVQAVSQGRCVLFLGAGVNCRPPVDLIHQYADQYAPLPGALAQLLAHESGFLSEFPNEDPHNLARVAGWYEVKISRMGLVTRLRAILAGIRPSPIVRALAALPFACIITSCFDHLFEDALEAVGKQPFVAIYDPRHSRAKDLPDPTPQRPGLYKLYGDIDRPESIVITDEDHIQHTLRMNDEESLRPMPHTIQYYLRKFPVLFLGWSFRDYRLRLIWRTLRFKQDLALLLPAYALELWPDPILIEIEERQRRNLVFIREDIWTFVSKLYETITKKPMLEYGPARRKVSARSSSVAPTKLF